MSAHISITVQNENFWVKSSGLFGLIRIFQKSKIQFILDGETHLLAARKEPYSFTVNAGNHSLRFIDPRGKAKRRGKAIGSAVVGGALGFGASGSGIGALAGALGSASIGATPTQDGLIVSLADDDNLRFACKSTGKGEVKLTAQND